MHTLIRYQKFKSLFYIFALFIEMDEVVKYNVYIEQK